MRKESGVQGIFRSADILMLVETFITDISSFTLDGYYSSATAARRAVARGQTRMPLWTLIAH
jgi:hypothetical protein